MAMDVASLSAQIAHQKDAQDILIMELGDGSTLWTSFVLCTVGSDLQARALCDALCEKLKDCVNHIEGYADARWILIDCDNVLVHIFLEDTRKLYNIEQLYKDAKLRRQEYGTAE